MHKLAIATVYFVTAMLFSAAVDAQTSSGFEKKSFNYSQWTKGLFAEVVTVTGPAKMIFVAGVGAENENGKAGDILHKGDFVAQCKYAYDKIRRVLEKQGAGFGNVVKVVSYVTDMRDAAAYDKCFSEAFGTVLPVNTLVNISQLAWPGMMLEVDVTAMVAAK